MQQVTLQLQNSDTRHKGKIALAKSGLGCTSEKGYTLTTPLVLVLLLYLSLESFILLHFDLCQ